MPIPEFQDHSQEEGEGNVEYRIAEIFINVVDGCIIIIHELITCDSALMKQYLTLTT